MSLDRRPLIVLAGGASRRMGTHKGLLPFCGRTWLEAQLEGFARAGGARAVVVMSHCRTHAAELPWVARALEEDARVAGLCVRVCAQPRPTAPPFASLARGLRRDRAVHAGAFVLPVDVPVAPHTWPALEAALGTGQVALPRFEGRNGHPVLLAPAFAARLLCCSNADPEARLDRQLASLDAGARRVVEVDEPTVRMNLNTPAEWSAWVASAHPERCYPPPP